MRYWPSCSARCSMARKASAAPSSSRILPNLAHNEGFLQLFDLELVEGWTLSQLPYLCASSG